MNVLINRTKQGSFASQCGLCQGDLLSPTLFILAADLLSRLIYDANEKGQIREFKIANGLHPITHLMFVDDIMLVGQALER